MELALLLAAVVGLYEVVPVAYKLGGFLVSNFLDFQTLKGPCAANVTPYQI